MSTLNYSQTLEMCSHSFTFPNEKTRTRRVENDKFANQVKSLSLNMKINYFKKVASSFLVIFLLLPTYSNSQQGLANFGAVDCGLWLKDNDRMKSLYKSWLLGFLTGMNLSDTKVVKANFLDRLSSSSQAYVFVDNYCQQNPLKNTIDAAMVLIFDLEKQK